MGAASKKHSGRRCRGFGHTGLLLYLVLISGKFVQWSLSAQRLRKATATAGKSRRLPGTPSVNPGHSPVPAGWQY